LSLDSSSLTTGGAPRRGRVAASAQRWAAVVREEARLGALLVAHCLEHLVDGGIESRSGWRRRDGDAAGAQAPTSGRPEVGRRHVAGGMEEAALPLVERAAAEAVVRRLVVAGVVRHGLELGDRRRGRVGEVCSGRIVANVAGQMR
jgi:hypothetical protein